MGYRELSRTEIRSLRALGRTVKDFISTVGRTIPKCGTYGYDYLLRAAITEGSLGANVPEEAIYAKTQTGTDGQPLSGANNYLMHFDKGNLPPVNAFWSLSMYNTTTHMFVPNSINSYSVSEQKNKFMYNPDGSLDIYIQNEEPVGKESNWLPAPKGDF